jgi:hypothetical protein
VKVEQIGHLGRRAQLHEALPEIMAAVEEPAPGALRQAGYGIVPGGHR